MSAIQSVNYQDHISDKDSIWSSDSMPSSSCVRCNAYLKKIAAIIISIVVSLPLFIASAGVALVGVPWFLCDCFLLDKETQDLILKESKTIDAHYKPLGMHAHYKPRNQWDRTDYIVAFCWGLSLPFALPAIGLKRSQIDDKVLKPVMLYSHKLWTEANEPLATVDAPGK